jgi:hypothetical protein
MPVLEVYERTTEAFIVLTADAPLPTCTPADPFGVDHDCLNPAGHHPIVSCGDIVCRHCPKVFWL